MFPSLQSRRAFTLIELLAVVTIMAILAYLLIVGAGVAIRKAGLARCSNNLRQVGLAATLYAADHHGSLPADSNKGIEDPEKSPAWFYRLPPYTDMQTVSDRISIFQCPNFNWQGGEHFDHASPKSYKMNDYLDKDGRADFYRLRSVYDESTIVYFVTAKAGETGVGQWGHCTAKSVTGAYHSGFANILFLDLHTTQAVVEPDSEDDWKHVLQWKSEDW